MSEIERLKALAAKATHRPLNLLTDARPKCSLVHVETGEGCAIGQGVALFSVNKALAAEAEWLVGLANAWPSLLARIEAGERLAEALGPFVECAAHVAHLEDHEEAQHLVRISAGEIRAARAALAAFAAAKESKHAGGAK